MLPLVVKFCSFVVIKTAPVWAVIVPTLTVPVLVVLLVLLVAVSLKLPTLVVPSRFTTPAAAVSLLVTLTMPVVPPVVTLKLTVVADAALPVLKPADVVPIFAPFVLSEMVPAVAS